MLTDAHLARPPPHERANLQLRQPGRAGSGDQRLVLFRGLLVLLRLEQRLGPRECAFEPAALVGRDAVREETGVDASRSASHSIVLSVGRVLPRSIWETYSFEKRSPARSLCVSPAATRSWRSRSPRRRPSGLVGERCGWLSLSWAVLGAP